MEIESQILLEENQSLTKRVSNLEKQLKSVNKKFDLALTTIKGVAHLVPNLFVKFEQELENIDGKD
tara:strand:+ start:20881 stop:21078 length:198 start_codon:yes stop_codon:yes gene_type:complete